MDAQTLVPSKMIFLYLHLALTLHESGLYQTERRPLICSTNQLTCF